MATDPKAVFQQVVEYPEAPQSLEAANKREKYGLIGALAGAFAGAVLGGAGGAIIGAPVGVKVGHILAAKM